MNTQNATLTSTTQNAQIFYRASTGKLSEGFIDFTKIDEDCTAILIDAITKKAVAVYFSVSEDLFVENVN